MTSSEHYQRIAYWLVPSKKDLSLFKQVVNELALGFNGPKFNPHVTVYVGLFSHTFHPKRILEELKTQFIGPIVLKPSDLCFSAQFTKSCYLDLQANSKISSISKFIQDRAITPPVYCLRPHMSLFYGNLTASDQMHIKVYVNFPKNITFDTVWAVLNPPCVTRKEDVESWRLMGNIVLPQILTS